ncbi:MAG: hypothetical protein ACI8XM_001994 [Haloarculaceae archaeon]|jgi:hypothetical protein
MTTYQDIEELDGRTRSRFTSMRLSDEEFVLAGRAADGMLSRWCTRVIVTTGRVLAIRHVLLEWDVEGVRHERIAGISYRSGTEDTLVIEHESMTIEYTFDDGQTGEALASAIRKLL